MYVYILPGQVEELQKTEKETFLQLPILFYVIY